MGEYDTLDEACDAVIMADLAENARDAQTAGALRHGRRQMVTDGNERQWRRLNSSRFLLYGLLGLLAETLFCLSSTVTRATGCAKKCRRMSRAPVAPNCRDWLPEAPEVVDAPSFLSNQDLLSRAGIGTIPNRI